MSFWKWLGVLILLLVVGGIIARIVAVKEVGKTMRNAIDKGLIQPEEKQPTLIEQIQANPEQYIY